MPDSGGGVLFAIEPKINIADNMNIGIRFESAAMAKNVEAGPVSAEASLTSSMSYSGTFDSYFNSGSSSFARFVGAGMGYIVLWATLALTRMTLKKLKAMQMLRSMVNSVVYWELVLKLENLDWRQPTILSAKPTWVKVPKSKTPTWTYH